MRLSQNIWPSAIIGIASLGTVFALQFNQIANLHAHPEQPSDVSRQLNIQLAKAVSLVTGFDNVAANMLWLQFIQYYGSNVFLNIPVEQRPGFTLSSDYLSSITKLDPNFFLPYGYALNAVAWKQGQPELAKEILLHGTQTFTPETQPRGFGLWINIGLIDFLFLGNSTGTEQAYDRAAQWLESLDEATFQSLRVPHPEAFRQLGQRLARNPDSNTARFMGWSQVYYSSRDPEVKGYALQQVEAVGGRAETDAEGKVRLIPPPSN